MNKDLRLGVAALVVVFSCLLLPATTSANRSIMIREGESGVTFSGRLKLINERLDAATETTCSVTLLGTISSVIPKIEGTLMGRITGVAIDVGTRGPEIDARRETEHCRHGASLEIVRRVVALRTAGTQGTPRELSNGIILYDVTDGESRLWKLVYDGFQGILPDLSSVLFHIEEIQYLWAITGGFGLVRENCLYKGRLEMRVGVADRRITGGEIPLSERTIPRQSGGSFCPANNRLIGTLAVRPALTIELL